MSEPATVEQLLMEARARLTRLLPGEARAASSAGAALIDIRSERQRARDGKIPGAKYIARNVLESTRLLANASRLLASRCVDGITAHEDRMRAYAESSPSIVTPLNSAIGYEEAAKVAKRALKDGATIRETVIAMGFVERGDLTEEQLDAALDVDAMTRKD